jgi:asparagine synthase (glutamine-hydrolysing)
MCGILGHLAFSEKYRVEPAEFNQWNDLLLHRGPDDSGSYLKDNVALAMRRLSIVDISHGKQPWISDDNRYALIFNGEIYNCDELRTYLQKEGYSLKTHCDTEVLLYMFIHKGVDCLPMLNGMFAFAVWDDAKKELFLARDHVGIKPLYYAMDANQIIFSSELTPIRASKRVPLNWDYQSISNYLAYWYICEPNTIYRDIFQLPPGSYARIAQGKISIERYWNIPSEPASYKSFDECAEQLHYLLQDSVKMQMHADVPVGTFLSGGIDSGLVTALASKVANQRLNSFSIGFKEKSYSELAEAQLTADSLNVNRIETQMGKITPDLIEPAIRAFDEPLGNASYVPTYFLSKLAAERVKVVLTGDGADELFGGYPTYQAPYFMGIFNTIPKSLLPAIYWGASKLPTSHDRISLDYRIKQFVTGASLPHDHAHVHWRRVASMEMQEKLFRPNILHQLNGYDPVSVATSYFDQARNLSKKNQYMYVDQHTFLLNDHLRKVDRMSMAHSLEARVPILDYRIVELAMQMPEEYKVTFFKTKRILKHVAQQYLPKSIIKGKKKGLTSPVAAWLYSDLREYAGDVLKGGIIDELFVPQQVSLLLNEHFTRKKDNSRILWALLTLQVWHQNPIQ